MRSRLAGRARQGVMWRACQTWPAISSVAHATPRFIQNLPLPTLFAATVFLALLLCWFILALVWLGVRMAGSESAKSLPIQDMVMVTSLMFALMLSFAAAGIWNDWVQARGAVTREAMELEHVIALTDGLSPSSEVR